MAASTDDLDEALKAVDASESSAEDQHCVHNLARQGNDLDAQIEKFLDDVLIDDIKQTPAELAKEKQDLEVRELEAATAALRKPSEPTKEGEAGASKADDNPFRMALPFKLEGAGRSKDLKPYVANLSDFDPETHVKRQMENLKSENEMLQRCLGDRSNPRAFEGYLRSKTTL